MGEPVDFEAKFSYINEFFKFYESNKKATGKYQLVFICVKCRDSPIVIFVKTSSVYPLSNLRRHITIQHQDYVPQFQNLLKLVCPRNGYGCKSTEEPRKPNKSSTKETHLKTKCNADLRSHNGKSTFSIYF